MRKLSRFLIPGVMHVLLAVVVSVHSPDAQADIAVIVHPDNPLATLDESEVRRIYMGRMHMFPASEQSIETVDHPESAPLFAEFYQAIAHLTPAKLKRQRASYLFSGKGRLPVVKDDDTAVRAYVAGTRSAIGYVDSALVDATVKVVWTTKTE